VRGVFDERTAGKAGDAIEPAPAGGARTAEKIQQRIRAIWA
jgi:hypothetical protein